jgi:hypothetical protein
MFSKKYHLGKKSIIFYDKTCLCIYLIFLYILICSEYIYKIPQNPLVNHTIELLRHKRELETRIELIEEEGILHKMDELPKLVEPVPKGQLCIPNIPMTGRDTKNIIQNQLTFSLAHAGFTRMKKKEIIVFLYID